MYFFISGQCFICMPSEKVTKRLVLWYFQGVWKYNIGLNGIINMNALLLTSILISNSFGLCFSSTTIFSIYVIISVIMIRILWDSSMNTFFFSENSKVCLRSWITFVNTSHLSLKFCKYCCMPTTDWPADSVCFINSSPCRCKDAILVRRFFTAWSKD